MPYILISAYVGPTRTWTDSLDDVQIRCHVLISRCMTFRMRKIAISPKPYNHKFESIFQQLDMES